MWPRSAPSWARASPIPANTRTPRAASSAAPSPTRAGSEARSAAGPRARSGCGFDGVIQQHAHVARELDEAEGLLEEGARLGQLGDHRMAVGVAGDVERAYPRPRAVQHADEVEAAHV